MLDHVSSQCADVPVSAALYDAVRAFFAAALATGAPVLHEPGEWPEYHHLLRAFVRGPDGNNVEAVCHRPE